VTVNVFLLHLNSAMNARKMTVAIATLLYLFFWVITNDLLTFNFLSSVTMVDGISLFSIAVQYPTFVLVYVYILWRVIKRSSSAKQALKSHWKLWACLCVSLGAWCANLFACKRWTGVFIGHVIWHIGIGYVAYYLTIIGAADTYGLIFTSDGFWLKLERKTIEFPYTVERKAESSARARSYELKVSNLFRS
jgi:hypothetical protein